MITFDQFSYTYPTGQQVLRDVSLTIPDGAYVIVTGVSGAGKSTLLRAINGLVPQSYGGRCSGRVVIDGQDTLSTTPRALVKSAGFVFQDPETQFVVQTVEDEIAFGLENKGISADAIHTKIGDVLSLLRISHLRQRRVTSLSGGEAQRVTIAAALALEPRCLILDEPTSQLDPPMAHDLLDTLVELNCHHRLTIVLAEHRLERVLRHATHWLYMGEQGEVVFGPPRETLPQTRLRPPIIEAALTLGWQPLPLSVEEACSSPYFLPISTPVPYNDPELTADYQGEHAAITVRNLEAGYNGKPIIEGFSWSIGKGQIVGLLGANGAGKSTLLKSMVGLLRVTGGEIRLMGQHAENRKPGALARIVGYVPQNPNSVLFADRLRDEVTFTLRNHKLPGDGVAFLTRLGLAQHADSYPRDLSGGERQRAALAAMLAAEPPVVLLDEPTRGLDYLQKRAFGAMLHEWAAAGRTIVVATHDVEWIATVAERITILERGRIINDGPTARVLLETPGFNTQLGELFNNARLMTPDKLRVMAEARASQR